MSGSSGASWRLQRLSQAAAERRGRGSRVNRTSTRENGEEKSYSFMDLTAQNDLVEITERIVLRESRPSPRQSGSAGRHPGHWDFSIRSQFASDYPQTRWQFGTERG